MMKLLLLSSLLAFASASPLLECSYGPSYWCKSIATAKKCGAVDHCISTIWAHQRVVKSDNDAVCDFCQGVISQVKTLLLSNETEGEIHSYFTKACSLIPEKFLRDKCNEVVDHYEAEIIKMIKAHLDPVAVCEAMGICKSGFSDTVHHPDKLVAKKRIPMKLGNATVCADCTKFFGDVKAMITSNSTKQQIISLIEQNVCSQLGNLEPECKQLVENYADAVVQLISSEVDPSKICQAMGFCGGDRSILIAMKLAKTKLYKAAQKPNVKSSALCSLCQEVLAALKISISLNTTQAEVEKFLEDNLCSKLGSLATACNDLITTEGKHIFELLVYGIDPPAICKAIGLCSAVVTDSKPVAVGGQLVKILKTPKVQGSVECTVCEFVADELEKLVGKNSTETEIIAALDKVCSLLPSTISKECEDFVKNYGPAVIALLVREVSPQVVCTALGLCSARVSGKVPVMVAARDSPTCAICEYMMNYMESLLSSNATEEDIKKALEAVCSYLPSSVSTECVSLVEQYADDIVKLLVEELKPSVVCTKLGLCNATSSAVKVSSLKVATPVQCVMCEYMVSQLESMLTKNATEEEIKSALDKVCKLLPATVASECQNVIDKYADEILKLLVKDVKPAAICTAIGLCNATIQLPSVRTSLQCDVCELAMSELEKYLGQKATQAEIMTGLQKVCTLVPSSLKDECSQIISRYGKAILQVLSQDLQPKLICRTLGLCNAVAIKAVKAKTYSCDYCNIFVVNMQSMMRGKPATQRELEDLLLKVCSFIPSNMQSTCSNYVDTYYSVIMKAFLDMKSNQLCSMIELCGQPKGWIRINSMQHSQKAMLGKGSKCMYGPRYWCASLENAKKCQAEQHCRNHVWN